MNNIEDVIKPQSGALLENNFNRANKFKESVAVAPDYIPTTWDEQIVIFDDTSDKRLYVYVDNSWHYITLT